MMRRWAGLLVLLAGCQPQQPATELHVFAAASLRQVLPAIDRAFEQRHPGVTVVANLAGTPALRAQVEAGARVDVFLSADSSHPAALHAAGLLRPPRQWITNQLVLAATPRNERVGSLSDASKPGVRLVACAPTVPAGAYTEQALRALAASRPEQAEALRANLVSREADVQAAAARLRLGEVDAGFVYRTDLRAAGLREVELPPEMRVEARYSLAIGAHSPVPELAADYAALLAGAEARAQFGQAGFGGLADER